MFKNFFKTAWRNLAKGKMHSLINITGLSIGMAVAILIGLWIYDEVSFNKNFKNHDRIAQVIQNVTNNGEVQTWWSVPYPLAEELRKNYGSDFKHVIMAAGWGDHLVKFGDKKLKQFGGFFENGFAEMLTLKMKKGSWKSLDDPTSILISASASKAFFGDDDPINKILKVGDFPVVKVGGVYNDFPLNSTFNGLQFISTFQFLSNNNNGFRDMSDPWRPNSFTLFAQLNDNADYRSASLKIKDAKLRKVNDQLKKKKPELFLIPMDRWHLYSKYENGVNTGGAIQYVWMFGIIGVFVLLLACINFMNLSTARSEKRAKEVGIRKTIGSLRKQLILQFFSESILTVFLAFLLSIALVKLALPLFNEVSGKQMDILWNSPVFWMINLVFIVFTALVAGSYPALYLSSFKPIKVLKGTFKAQRYAAIPRKALVVLQFTVSVTLIIGTIVVYRQIQFAKNRPVGYSRDGLVSVHSMSRSIHDHFDAMRQELIQNGAITAMAESGSPTTEVWGSTSGFSWPEKDPNQSIDFGTANVSYEYGKTIEWEMAQGRDFSREFGADSASVIVNEAAAKFMGLKNPIGTPVTLWDQKLTVIGVIKDMVMNSPYDPARPLIYALGDGQGSVAIVKINPKISASAAIAKIETVFKKFNTEEPFEYRFVNDEYGKKFGDEERVSKLAGFFAALAIAISCLGLLGLTSFVAEQRKKEIGVRKVLGASVFNVWNLLSKEFILLVMLSFAIAVPVSYYFMNSWLQNYEYRTEISWWIFAVAGLGSLLITIAVVSMQAIKAAIANPVKSLRTE